MDFIKAADMFDRDELIGQVAFLESVTLWSSICDELRRMIISFLQKLCGLIRPSRGWEISTLSVDGENELTGSPLIVRMMRRRGKLAILTDAELRERLVSRLRRLGELPFWKRAGGDEIDRAMLLNAATSCRIETQLISAEDVERRIFAKYVLDNMSALQRYNLSVSIDDLSKVTEMLKGNISDLTDRRRELAAQVRRAEFVASKVFSDLMRGGIIFGMAALLWSAALLGLYAALAIAEGMSGGLLMPAIILGVLFVIDRRFKRALTVFVIAMYHARVKRDEMGEPPIGTMDLSEKEREIAALKQHIEALKKCIEDFRGEEITDSLNGEMELKQASIVILGEGHVNIRRLSGIAKGFGIDPDNMEFIGYQKLKHFDIEKLRWSRYDGIIIAEVPHSAKGVESSNIIEYLKGEGFPPMEVCRESAGDIKLSKKSFSDALERLIAKITKK